MIRLADSKDLPMINSIGMLISNDFSKKNHVEERLKYDYVNIFIYEKDNKVVGFIEVEKHFEVVDVINIAVHEEFQNNGIATLLINHIILNLKPESIILEVNEKNTKAISFYIKNKFVEINRRKKYYESEYDAIIMERKIV